jgi:hypothetical protein
MKARGSECDCQRRPAFHGKRLESKYFSSYDTVTELGKGMDFDSILFCCEIIGLWGFKSLISSSWRHSAFSRTPMFFRSRVTRRGISEHGTDHVSTCLE